MPHRDPQTGQFVSSGSSGRYADYEVATFQSGAGVQAADLAGSTGFDGEQNLFEGLQLIDYDEIVDRNESLELLRATHILEVYANSTETKDGFVEAAVEVSSSPTRQVATVNTNDSTITADTVGFANSDDTIDVLSIQQAGAGAPFSDDPTGVGGSGSAGHDHWRETIFPAEIGQFHPRDELFLNGDIRTWNIQNAGVHVNVVGQHLYGVLAD